MQIAKIAKHGLGESHIGSLQFLRLLSEQSSEGFLAFDMDKKYLFWSHGMEVISGMTSEEVIGKNAMNVFPFLKDVGIDKAYERALSGETVLIDEAPYKIPESKKFGFFKARYAPFFDEHGKITGGIGVVQDITEEKVSRALTQETENRFRNLADSSPVMLWMAGPDGLCNFFNSTWLEFTGRSLDQEIGVGWAECVYFEDFQRCMDIYMDSFKQRQSFEMEYRLKRRDGVFRWILDRATPRYLEDGTFAGYVGSCVDITEKKNIESELRSAITMREEFLSIASHELKTPLTALNLQLGLFQYLLKNNTEPSTTLREKMDSISALATKQIQSLARLIENLLDVSRLAAGRLNLDTKEIDLTETVTETVNNHLAQAHKSGSEITINGCGPIIGLWDKVRIEQVMINLLTNAIKYGNGKPIQVRIVRNKDSALITVKDFGLGIKPEFHPMIFEKYQRSKINKNIDGLGLGLFITKQIIDQHGGKIGLNSSPGQGSEFYVELPIRSSPAL